MHEFQNFFYYIIFTIKRNFSVSIFQVTRYHLCPIAHTFPIYALKDFNDIG